MSTADIGIIGNGEQTLRRYPCMFDGCDKTFMRKEHLGRHERTHNPQTLCICKVCNRKFNRSDSLLRHLARHGDAFKPNPSGRSKRACISCHTGKTKCDGNQPCSTCQKKETDCIYRNQDGQDSQSNEAANRRLSGSPRGSESMSIILESSGTPVNAISHHTAEHDLSRDLTSATSSLSLRHGGEMEAAMITMPPPKIGYIDWMSTRIRNDPEIPLPDPKLRVDPTARRYLNSFFENFHHRWGLIHRPSFEEDKKETPLIKAMRMIGAWLCGTQESRSFAITQHEELMDNIIPRLHRSTSHDPLCLGLCETALLNIIFGLYYGNDKTISKLVLLRNLLVAVLREVEFFKSETAWADEQPEYFLPMRLAKLGQRQRHVLAANLFKTDTYLSILRCQPNSLMPEELYYTLPSTYAVWNANGLHVWEERQATEPHFRSERSMVDMIKDSFSEASSSASEYPMLIEDIQLCICAIQSDMWKLFHPVGSLKDCEIDVVLHKDTLRIRLNALKIKLDRMANQNTGNFDFGDEPYLPLRSYYGYEDHSLPGWKEIVSSRVKSLLFDALMLSHLFNLHLHADIGMLTQLGKDQYLSIIQKQSERHCRAREQRIISTRSWAHTSTARQAVCHAVEVLIQHQTISRDINHILGLDKNTMDPIAYIAVSVAALVVWAYSMFGPYSCDNCTPCLSPATLVHGFHAVELTRLSNPSDPQQHGEKELWINMGGGTRIQLQGVQICLCNIDFVVALFQNHLPSGWEVADKIAPNIFKH